MDKIKFFTRIFLVMALLLSIVHTAQAAPPLPSQFHGEIHVLDNPPIVGSVINAYVPGVVPAVGTATVTTSGGNLVYTISVLGDDPDTGPKDGGLQGDMVTFRFGTRILGIGYWQGGVNQTLDFHPPQAIAGGPYSGPEGSNITFAALANDFGSDVSIYEWDMDNNGTYEISGANPSVTFPNSGSYTVGLWVTDSRLGEGFATATVNVSNVAPSLAVYFASISVNEGTIANNAGTISDPGSDVTTVVASVGTAVLDGLSAWEWSFTPTDGPAQSQTVTITATDADGATGTTTFALVVNNLSPVGTLGNNGPVAEGSPAIISFTGQADASPQDVAAGFRYAFACDNGSLDSATYANSSATPSIPCIFVEPPATHNVRGRIIDKDNGYTEYTTNVLVSNANPVVTVNQGTVTVNEGSLATNTGTFSDPGGDPVTLSASPVGTVTDTGGGTWSWSYTPSSGPASGGPITILAVDPQGGVGGVTFNLVVNNVAPTANPGGPYTVNEGSPVNFIGTAYDPGADDSGALLYEWDFNYISPNFTVDTSGSLTPSPTYSNTGVYIAALRATDTQFATGIGTTTVTILNTPPTSASAGGPYSVAPNGLLNMHGYYTCVSVDICTTYSWDLDNDGLFDDATGIIASYTWTLEGVYPISFRVTDDDGTYATGSTTVTVATTFTHSIPLVVGWNLVSFNLHPTDTATGTVLADITGHYDLVYAWDASGAHSSAGNWLRYDPALPFLSTLTTLNETQGFWIHMTTADTLDVTGTIVATSSVSLLNDVGGWNLVGYPSTTDRATSSTITAEMTLLYAYHASDTDLWKLYDRNGLPFLNDLATMTPGWGYWIFVTADSTWSVGY